MGTKMADYGVAGLENPDFPHCEKVLYIFFQNIGETGTKWNRGLS
jgi:hypothetical protein